MAEVNAYPDEGGFADDVLATWASVLPTSDLVSDSTIAEESADVAVYFGNRE